MVRSMHLQENFEVERKGIYYFDSTPFIVKIWNPEMDLHTESIKSLPLWLPLPDLDIKYWGLGSLSKIGSLIGHPLKSDKYTAEKSMLNYARLLVDVPLDGPFPECVEFFNEKEVLIRQPVKFEWLPSKCSFCGMFDHLEEVCRKKSAPKKEWRRVEQGQTAEAPQRTMQQQINPATLHITSSRKVSTNSKGKATIPIQDITGFTPVTKKAAARMVPQQSILETMEANSFQLLQFDKEYLNHVEQMPGAGSND